MEHLIHQASGELVTNDPYMQLGNRFSYYSEDGILIREGIKVTVKSMEAQARRIKKNPDFGKAYTYLEAHNGALMFFTKRQLKRK